LRQSAVEIKQQKSLGILQIHVPNSKRSLPPKSHFKRFKNENVLKIENKLDPALLQTSHMSAKIKKDNQIWRDYPFKRAVLPDFFTLGFSSSIYNGFWMRHSNYTTKF
jgi:hypothetical protein